MEITHTNLKNKQAFYGFRKAFIQNPVIPHPARFLLILLLTYKGKNNACWPSQGDLSKKMGVSKDTIRKYLGILEKEGYLITKSRGVGRSLLYTPSYWKISAGKEESTEKDLEPGEITIHEPDEFSTTRSIVSGNKNSTFKIGKDLFNQKRKELGLI